MEMTLSAIFQIEESVRKEPKEFPARIACCASLLSRRGVPTDIEHRSKDKE
jgi:hypothetical protein